MHKILVSLERQARKKGGDRYEGTVPGEVRPLVLYIPQYISRAKDGTPFLTIQVTFGAPIDND